MCLLQTVPGSLDLSEAIELILSVGWEAVQLITLQFWVLSGWLGALCLWSYSCNSLALYFLRCKELKGYDDSNAVITWLAHLDLVLKAQNMEDALLVYVDKLGPEFY